MNTVSRRRLLIGTSRIGAAAMAWPSLNVRAQTSTRELVVSSWGGSFQDALREVFFKPFEKEAGVQVKEVTFGGGGLAKVKAQLAAGRVEVDLLDGPPFWAAIGQRDGLTQKIDLQRVQDRASHYPASLDEWGYGYGSISWGIGYNVQSFPNRAPKSWADFWDPSALPGARALFGPIAARHIEYALMADGLAPKDVNPLAPAKVDRAFAALHRIKKAVNVWYESNSQIESLLMQREIDLGEFVHNRATAIERSGGPVRFEFNQAVMNLLTWVLAKEAPNRENALRFVAFCSRADRQAEFARKLFNGPTNSKALALVNDDFVMARLPTHPRNLERQVLLDGAYWASNLDALGSRWTQVTTG